MKEKRNYKLFILVVHVFIIVSSINHAQAQAAYIKGKVINYFTNETISFASVQWKKAGNGVITDSAGNLSLREFD